MIHAYIDRNGNLCIRPATPDGEDDIEKWEQKVNRDGLSQSIDVQRQMPEEQYQHYKRRKQSGEYSGGRDFGFSPRAESYFPMPPDFSPQAHWTRFPLVIPIWFERDGGSGGGYDGGVSGGQQGGSSAVFDFVTTAERNRGGRGNDMDGVENPRDTGRRDTRNR